MNYSFLPAFGKIIGNMYIKTAIFKQSNLFTDLLKIIIFLNKL